MVKTIRLRVPRDKNGEGWTLNRPGRQLIGEFFDRLPFFYTDGEAAEASFFVVLKQSLPRDLVTSWATSVLAARNLSEEDVKVDLLDQVPSYAGRPNFKLWISKTQKNEKKKAGPLKGLLKADLFPRPQEDEGFFDTSDLAWADRLLARSGDHIRYAPDWQSLVVWNGATWTRRDAEAALQTRWRELLNEVEEEAEKELESARAAFKEVKESSGPPDVLQEAETRLERAQKGANETRVILTRARSVGKLKNVIDAVKREEKTILPASGFDADPWILNTPSGIVDLQTGELLPHDPERFCTKMTSAPFDTAAECPIFESVVEMAMGGDQDLIRYFKRRLGSSLVGENVEQLAVFWTGAGANGKGTLANAIRRVFGDYGRDVDPETFMKKNRSSDIREDVMAMEGARFVATSEIEDGTLDGAMFKRMTGGDPIVGRGGYEKVRALQPTWSVFMLTNDMPHLTNPGHALWRRIEILPFDTVVTKSQQDPQLPSKLDEEASGILRWLVEGCVEWVENGCTVGELPEKMKEALRDYQEREDDVGTWARHRCEFDSEARTPFNALFEDYTAWCRSVDETPRSRKAFGSRLKRMGDRGVRQAPGNSTRAYDGIRIRQNDSNVVQLHGEGASHVAG